MKHGSKNELCRDKKGATPLHYAVVQARSDVIQLLISLGANPNVEGRIFIEIFLITEA